MFSSAATGIKSFFNWYQSRTTVKSNQIRILFYVKIIEDWIVVYWVHFILKDVIFAQIYLTNMSDKK